MLPAKILKFIETHRLLDPQDKILVAYSGGADSTCLLLILTETYQNVAALYVNHQLRGAESNEEQNFVRDFCEKRQIHLYVETIRWNRIPSDLEQAARKRRYRHFAKVAAEQGTDKIALAHHRDDSVETFLLNLFRGSGPRGLQGLRPRRGIYVRPMLECSRAEILEYLETQRVPFFTDSSNESLQFRRNRLRRELIPYIQKHFNPGIHDAILRTSRWIAEQNQLVAELLEPARKLLLKQGEFWQFDRCNWEKFTPHQQKALLKLYLEDMDPDWKIDAKNIHSVIRGIQNSENVELPGLLWMDASGPQIRFSRKTGHTIGRSEVDVPGPGDYKFFPGNVTLSFEFTPIEEFNPAQNVAFLDADKASFPLYIRNWKKGDSFQPLGMEGRKKLSDYWTDKKVPRGDRKTIPLVFKDDDLIWLGGHQIHDHYKVTPSTNRLLRIQLNKNA